MTYFVIHLNNFEDLLIQRYTLIMAIKVINISVQIIVTAVIYAIMLWLFDYVFEDISAFGWRQLLQGLIFAVIFVPISNWMSKRDKNMGNNRGYIKKKE